jgi:DHA3 family macrolide efflux protein-like MFS transporter
VLITGILLGLILGLLAGGSFTNLATIRLRWIALLSSAVILRFGTEAALNASIDIVETLRVPLLGGAFAILLTGLWANRSFPGMSLAFVGILSNAIVIVVNGGHMPVFEPSLALAGIDPEEVRSAVHVVVGGETDLRAFLLMLGPLADIIPIPLPFIQNVGSIGDVFLTVGLAFFLFAGVVRTPTDPDLVTEPHADRLTGLAGSARLPRSIESVLDERSVRPETGLVDALAETAALERPLVLGAGGAGLAAPSTAPALAPLPSDADEEYEPTTTTTTTMAMSASASVGAGTAALPSPFPLPRPEVAERIRRHPYVRLALNGSFSALWAGQIISLFGDRMHQVALAAVVLITTGSPLATGLVFMVATLPNLLFSPIAGAFVDRWEHKDVLVVSDILRAAVVLLIPLAIAINVVLVYPLVFILTTISIFFRPARVAILPRIVRKDELLTANSALWVAETSADIIGYPLAALFVAALGTALPLAFWLDAATYVGSAILLAAIAVKPRTHDGPGAERTGLTHEMAAGWRFLRHEATLLANTIQAAVAQIAIGVLVALAIVYAEQTLDGSWGLDYKAIYGLLEAGIGAGNLIGGFVIGLIGARFAKGKLIIAGYTGMGLGMVLLAFTGDLGLALGLMFGIGVTNMIFVIPSQTLFQERTPQDMMGRVIGLRFAFVGGTMTLAMGLGGLLGEFFPAALVLSAFGVVTMAAGLVGLFVRAIREA